MKFFVFSVSILILSCSQTPQIQYKYSDKEQPVTCSDKNDALLNEALHSFEDDISKYNTRPTKTRITAYEKYIYKGMLGTIAYKDIVNEHSLVIRDQLIEAGIINKNKQGSNLNYNHTAVQCIINNIESPDKKRVINALIQANSMNPTLLSSKFRGFGSYADKKRYEATYIALDSYYQNLVDIEKEND